uniref:non-specific serine/threonine protein kinase n=1 Tax=Mycena chlorophos TaxID=658473 RepID=A0ABQ0LF09_MYCCL|nr:CMGC/SRPK protein kinase [Mycena chlorophos]
MAPPAPYAAVNDRPSPAEESPAEYNTGGYLPVKLGDQFKAGRYRTVRKLGWGFFSTVWLVQDTQQNRHSALKVVKSAARYAETARDEIKLLARVAAASPLHPGREHIVAFMDSFSHDNHVCIVFEPLGENLLALIERHRRKGVPRALVKIIAKQILLGLQYLHDECDLVHTDLKPENILIAIPNVEEFINAELTYSPSPTSRHVGIPPPKTRPSVGVSIPRSRRTVQIFDSQPIGSPKSSRSAGLGSGPNSVSSSYVSPVQLSHLAKLGANGLSSSAPKVPSGLSASAPRAPPASKSTPATAASSHANSPTSPPSTSSSSSSVSSTPFSAPESPSTPPTSLSNSFGSAMTGLLSAKVGKLSNVPTSTVLKEPAGLPMNRKKQSIMESELEDALSTSWKEKLGLVSTSPQKSTSSTTAKPKPPRGHTRSSSSISISGSWKDPGLAAPAPAVVVSAVVGAGGEEKGDYFRLAERPAISSQSSSATVTPSQPSPPPNSTPSQKPTVSNPNPSLLSQTAPRAKNGMVGPAPGVLRVSPPKPTSSHVHAQVPPPSPEDGRGPLPLSPSSATSLTPTAATPPPSSPPFDFSLPHLQTPALSLPQTRPSPAPQISIKIADLGNATPSKVHFTEDIQTRQYRSPEAIIGRRDWGCRADIWSVACVVFELLTAEFLFDPQGQPELFTKDDDHMAQIIELLGDFPLDVKTNGKYSRDLFDSTGSLRYIKTLKPWPLKRVMTEKYLWHEADATVLCSFLEPMLSVDPRNRADAKDLLDHQWLKVSDADDVVGEW